MKKKEDGCKRDGVIEEEYAALEERIAVALDGGTLSDAAFQTLALDVHGFQRRHNRPYDRYCQQEERQMRRVIGGKFPQSAIGF